MLGNFLNIILNRYIKVVPSLMNKLSGIPLIQSILDILEQLISQFSFILPIITYILGVITNSYIKMVASRTSNIQGERVEIYKKMDANLDSLTRDLMDPSVSFNYKWNELAPNERSMLLNEDVEELKNIQNTINEFRTAQNDLSRKLEDKLKNIDTTKLFNSDLFYSVDDESQLVLHDGIVSDHPTTTSVADWIFIFGYPLIETSDSDDIKREIREYADKHELNEYEGSDYWDHKVDDWNGRMWRRRNEKDGVWEVLIKNKHLFTRREKKLNKLQRQSQRMSEKISKQRIQPSYKSFIRKIRTNVERTKQSLKRKIQIPDMNITNDVVSDGDETENQENDLDTTNDIASNESKTGELELER